MNKKPRVKKTKIDRLVERLLTAMGQTYQARYKPTAAQLIALGSGLHRMQEEKLKMTTRLLALLIPDDETDAKAAQQRAKLRTQSVGAETVITTLLQIYTDHLPQPDAQHGRLLLVLDVPMPLGVSVRGMEAYVVDAVRNWSGQFNPAEDPLFGFAHNELLNPIRVRPMTVEDDLPKTMDSVIKRFKKARKALIGVEGLLAKAHAAMAGELS